MLSAECFCHSVTKKIKKQMQNNHPIFGSGSIYLYYSSVTKYHIKHVHKYHSNSMMKKFSNPSVRDSIEYTVYVDYFICMCFRFPAQPQSLWEKKNVTTSFVCFNAFEETEEWETRSFNLAQNTLITAAFRGWFATFIGTN